MQFVRLYAGNSGCFKFWENKTKRLLLNGRAETRGLPFLSSNEMMINTDGNVQAVGPAC